MNISHLKSICEAATPAKHWAELHTVEADDAEEETILAFILTFNPATITKILAVVEAANNEAEQNGVGKELAYALFLLENDK